MAHQMIHKDIGLEYEPTYGASVTGTATRIKVRSVDIEQNPNKELVEETIASVRGRDRMTILRYSVEGSISAYASPRTLHHLFQLANGSYGSTTAVGTSATLVSYQQNTSGTWLSASVNEDYNNSQDKFTGIAVNSLEISASDGLVEVSADAVGQALLAGVSLPAVLGETIKPISYYDLNVYIARGTSANGLTLLRVSEWSLTYNNGVEAAYLSGSPSVARVDPRVPTLEGNFTIFHDDNNYRSATFGCTEFFVRIEGSLQSCKGLIAGVTPYFLRIDIPRVELVTNTKNYEQAELAKEEISFSAMLQPGLSYLWLPQLTIGLNDV